VDFGGGLERTLAALNNEPDIFKSELFSEIIEEIKKITNKTYSDDNLEPMRIIADHIKSAVFLILDGIKPSNKDQGYVLRKLLRRSAVKFHQIGGSLSSDNLFGIVDRGVLYTYDGEQGVNRGHDRDLVNSVLTEETGKFLKTMDQGLKLIDKLSPFDLFQTYGFPPELTMELLKKRGVELDWNKFEDEMKLHREKSRTASAGMFKGGLADQSEIVTKYHTATHLLHAALRQVLGEEVHQAGSNLTAERLRFDFTFTRKLTEEEIEKITEIVNDQIKKGLEQKKEIMTYDEAIKSGALAFFKDKYPEKVTVYSFGNFSKEICGGPHVANTNLILEPANTSRLAVQDEQAPRRDSEAKRYLATCCEESHFGLQIFLSFWSESSKRAIELPSSFF
jgi:alanyl-tRNA synthetase